MMAGKEVPCSIEICGEWTLHRYAAFQMLYVPLIKADAAMLYHTLLSIGLGSHKIKNHILIQKISGQSFADIEKNRLVLEQYLLIKTYYNHVSNGYLYQLFMPKDGNAFLSHEVFGRLYMKEMGRQVYEFNKLSFANASVAKDAYEEITIPFVNTLKDDWLDQQEEQFNTLKPSQDIRHQNDVAISFNYDRFLHGFSTMVFPSSQRNEKNLRMIGELATIHGIDEMDMRKIVSKSVDLKTNTLQLDRLKKRARSMRPTHYESKEKNPYHMPPVRFLQSKQHGVMVSRADTYLIESLISDYRMKPEVVNVLIEYVLKTKNMQFPKAYVEKIASTWVRLSIDTCEKAIQQANSDPSASTYHRSTKEKELPTWYHDQSSVKTGTKEFDEAELEEKLKKLRGE